MWEYESGEVVVVIAVVVVGVDFRVSDNCVGSRLWKLWLLRLRAAV